MTTLAETLAAEDTAEDRGDIHGDDRTTCHTHQSWFVDCVSDPTHANPVTGFNWCRTHRHRVHYCRCWTPNVTGVLA